MEDKRIDLLRRLQGDMSLDAFAASIDVARSTISMIYLGKRAPGRQFLEKLLIAFPEHRDEIIDVFLP